VAHFLRMTQTYSQKRYRHNNNNNTAPRFRDQPPRFKRQKSNTDPEGENCENNLDIASSGSLKASVDNTVLHSTMKNPLKMVSGQVLRMVPVQPNAPQLSVDTEMVNQFNTQPVSTSYSYRDLAMYPQSYSTPPFSPVSTSSSISVHEMSGYPQTASPVRYASPYNVSPGLEMANVRNSGWISPSNISSQNNVSSRTKNQNPEDKVVYSDPDKQTILLLRELERVADEKEKEDQQKEKVIGNNGTDRKNLVSHHLRMLMCAVDRYTADVDETSSSDGGVSEASASPAPSPCPTPTPKCQTPQSSGQWQMKQSRRQQFDSNVVNRHGELQSQQINGAASNNIAWNRSPPTFSKSVPPPCIPFYSSPPPSLINRNSYPTPPPSREPTPTSYHPSYNNVPYNTIPTVNSNRQMPLVNPTKLNTEALPTPQESLAHILSPMSSSSSQYNYGMSAGTQAQSNGWNLWNSPSFMPFEQYNR